MGDLIGEQRSQQEATQEATQAIASDPKGRKKPPAATPGGDRRGSQLGRRSPAIAFKTVSRITTSRYHDSKLFSNVKFSTSVANRKSSSSSYYDTVGIPGNLAKREQEKGRKRNERLGWFLN